MENIELFDTYCGAILSSLYEAFPVPTAIDGRKLCGHSDINEFGRILDDLGRPSRPFEIAMSTASWLADAGFITLKNGNRYGHASATLTLSGLKALNAVPDSIACKETRGAKLVRLMREGSTALACEVTKAVLSAGVSANMA